MRNLADQPDTQDQLGLRNTSNMTRQEVDAKREQFRVGLGSGYPRRRAAAAAGVCGRIPEGVPSAACRERGWQGGGCRTGGGFRAGAHPRGFERASGWSKRVGKALAWEGERVCVCVCVWYGSFPGSIWRARGELVCAIQWQPGAGQFHLPPKAGGLMKSFK